MDNEELLDEMDFIMDDEEQMDCISNGGKVKRGLVPKAAQQFSVSQVTIKRIWKQGKECEEKNLPVNVSSRKPTRVGLTTKEFDWSKITEIPLRRRTNIRSLAKALNIPKSTVHRQIKKGKIRKHTNAIKPAFTTEIKKARLEFCLEKIQENLVFEGMYNVIHIDEKWFYMTKTTENYYLHPEEEDPHRTCQSKRFIKKVMFIAAAARPRFNSFGEVIFDGKLGIFPFVVQEAAKRSSKNRPRGTIEDKPIDKVNKDITRECLINKLLPAIRKKWPTHNKETIYIQQDNAKPHVKLDDDKFMEEAAKDGFDIRLRFQPAQSPDMNVLDLGFFRAIQSLQHQEAPTTVNELLMAVNKSFEEYSPQSLNDIFLTLQLARTGELPTQIEVSKDLVREATEYLSSFLVPCPWGTLLRNENETLVNCVVWSFP
ncbi:hypothetical protein MKW94_009849 [Papaver nudicaule]|uniref:DUF7769 domain-containing protein n=1 Tax=Papaver nudicaule TaxID=74823 RepID=A0AA41RWY4_PAPNU|nr:hypothetical protein [Papaver nudicaule]